MVASPTSIQMAFTANKSFADIARRIRNNIYTREDITLLMNYTNSEARDSLKFYPFNSCYNPFKSTETFRSHQSKPPLPILEAEFNTMS